MSQTQMKSLIMHLSRQKRKCSSNLNMKKKDEVCYSLFCILFYSTNSIERPVRIGATETDLGDEDLDVVEKGRKNARKDVPQSAVPLHFLRLLHLISFSYSSFITGPQSDASKPLTDENMDEFAQNLQDKLLKEFSPSFLIA